MRECWPYRRPLNRNNRNDRKERQKKKKPVWRKISRCFHSQRRPPLTKRWEVIRTWSRCHKFCHNNTNTTNVYYCYVSLLNGTCSRFLRNSTGRSWSIISNNRYTGPFSSHLKKNVLVRTTGEFSDRHVSCKCKITFLEKV